MIGTWTLSSRDLASLLADDLPAGDLTTDSLAIGGYPARLTFSAKQEMVICASEEASKLFVMAGAQVNLVTASGNRLGAGEPILIAEGKATGLHGAWKTAQTLVEWASGIATATAAIVAAAGSIPVACTRKHVPGAKRMSAKAVKAGGGIMHRLGLSETLLVFAEHRLFLNESPPQTIQRLRKAQPEKKIVVEVGDVQEAILWATAGADVLQLERFHPEEVAHLCITLGQNPQRPRVATAGGISADNAAAYATAGADLLVTSAPYTAVPKDVQVTFERMT
jgi:molybdenum transport protein